MKIKHLFVSILLATGFQPMIAQSALRQQFVNSSVQEARPWTFWYWMFGAVTPEGITADLEAMHRVGLGWSLSDAHQGSGARTSIRRESPAAYPRMVAYGHS